MQNTGPKTPIPLSFRELASGGFAPFYKLRSWRWFLYQLLDWLPLG